MENHDLKAAFRELRVETERSTPPFDVPALPVRRHWPRRTLAYATAVAALAVGVIFGRDWISPPQSELVDLSAVVWTSPTDFLLEVPGSEFITSLPNIATELDLPEEGEGSLSEGGNG